MTDEPTGEERESRHPQFGTVLLYDGECPFCSAATRALRHLDETGIISWDHPTAQSFLTTQFGESPFALILVDGEANQIWAGRTAAQELSARAGMPALVEEIVKESYDGVADAVRRVSGVDRDPDPFHGTFEITRSARNEFKALARDASRPRDRSHFRF